MSINMKILKKVILLMMISINCYADNWICINRSALMCNTWKMSIPQGYLVASDNMATGGEHGYAMVFVSDINHSWG